MPKEKKNVIADTVLCDTDDMKDCEKIIGIEKVIYMLVYCPFAEIPKRVKKRNESGDKDEERTLRQAITQITDMFDLSLRRTSKSIDFITKKNIKKTLKLLKKEMMQERKRKKKPKTKKQIKKTIKSFKKRLYCGNKKLRKKNLVYITPKETKKIQYQAVIINCSHQGPIQSAKRIVNTIKSNILRR